MKRILTAIVAMMLVLCMVTSAMALVLRPGDKGSAVKSLQSSLNSAIGAGLKVDGVYGPATTAAVMQFQSQKGLVVDGKAGPNTLAALAGAGSSSGSTSSTVLKLGSTGAEVTALQSKLAALNYPVTVDGTYGTSTYHAVVLFQTLNGLKVDGKAGVQTKTALYGPNPVPYGGSASVPVTPGNIQKVMLSTYAPYVGEVITASVVPSGLSVTYTWYRDEDGKKLGTGASYTVKVDDLYSRIYCMASGSNGSASSSRTSYVQLTEKDAAKRYLTGSVTLPATVQPGAKLVPTIYLNPDYPTDEGIGLYYMWYVGGEMKASTSTLEVLSSWVGKEIRLVVKAADESLAKDKKIEGTLSSNTCKVVSQTSDGAIGGTGEEDERPQILVGIVKIPAEAKPGDVVKATLTDVNCPEADLRYSWTVEGLGVVSTGNDLMVTSAYLNKNIHLVVTPRTDCGYIGSIGTNYCFVREEVKAEEDQFLTGKVTLPARAVVGATLTADVSELGTSELDYAWYVDDVRISTQETLTLASNTVGSTVYVKVTAKTGSGYFGTVTSTKCVVHAPENADGSEGEESGSEGE